MTATSLDEKIGQMLIVGFKGFELNPESTVAKDLSYRKIGGVILFDKDMTTASARNVQSPSQVKKLVAQAKALGAPKLIVGIDHEGGFVCRLKEKYGFPKTRTALELGQLPEDEFIVAIGQLVNTLAEVGINFNFAPSVDVNVNSLSPAIGKYDRSFSADPEVVAAKAAVFVEQHRQRRVLTSLKHFPGHGSSREDSHLGMTDITETWKDIELTPFARLIKSGHVDAVMTAHVFHRALDPKYPATLSPTIIPEILRKRMGFNGVVISDDLQMGAITNFYGLEIAIELALNADIDILSFGNNVLFDECIAEKAIAVIKNLLAIGAVTESRIERSYQRIQEMKARLP